jgi:hypothetical protein
VAVRVAVRVGVRVNVRVGVGGAMTVTFSRTVVKSPSEVAAKSIGKVWPACAALGVNVKVDETTPNPPAPGKLAFAGTPIACRKTSAAGITLAVTWSVMVCPALMVQEMVVASWKH